MSAHRIPVMLAVSAIVATVLSTRIGRNAYHHDPRTCRRRSIRAWHGLRSDAGFVDNSLRDPVYSNL